MCNQCVTPVHLGIQGSNISVLESVHNGWGRVGAADPGSFMRTGTEQEDNASWYCQTNTVARSV